LGGVIILKVSSIRTPNCHAELVWLSISSDVRLYRTRNGLVVSRLQCGSMVSVLRVGWSDVPGTVVSPSVTGNRGRRTPSVLTALVAARVGRLAGGRCGGVLPAGESRMRLAVVDDPCECEVSIYVAAPVTIALPHH